MTDEQIAQAFHEAYERLAPSFGYATREASAKPWADVPANNRALMTAVAGEVRALLVGGQAEPSDAEWGVRQQPSGSVTVVSGPRSAQAIARNRGRGAEAVTRRVTPWAAAAVSGEQPQRTADERLTAMAREYREHINAATGRSEPAKETRRKHRNELVLDRLRVQAILDAGR